MSAAESMPKTRSIANLDRRSLIIGASVTATVAGGMIQISSSLANNSRSSFLRATKNKTFPRCCAHSPHNPSVRAKSSW